MADGGVVTPDSLNRDKWEDFEEENGEISDHYAEISDGHQTPNDKFSEHKSISEQKALGQQGNSSFNKESGVTGTGPWENLEQQHKDFELPQSEESVNSEAHFDRADTASNRSDKALAAHQSVLQSNGGGLAVPGQSGNLSATQADGTECQVNGETRDKSHVHSSTLAAASHTSKGIADNSITLRTSEWTSFEDSQEKDSPEINNEATTSVDIEHLTKTNNENIENHTSLPLKTASSKMAAFDSQQAAVTTNIISNLSAVTEPQSVKTNSVSSKQATRASNIANANEESSNSMKSAVPIVTNNSALPNSTPIATQRVEEQSRETVSQENAKLGKKWVSFGDEGNSNVGQQKSDDLVSGSDAGNLGTRKPKLDDRSASGNGTIQTSSAVSSQAETKSTSVLPPMSFTSAELDLLASKSWIKFDDSNKSNHKQQPSSSSATAQPAAHSWITFGDSSAPVGQNLDLLELDVGGTVKTTSVPSPNPFASATSPQVSNPFKPAASNPFQADNTVSASVSPYPAENQGPISSSTPLVSAKPLLVSANANAAQLNVTPQVTVVGNSALNSSTVDKDTGNQDEVDVRAVLLEDKPVTSGSWSMLLRFPDKKHKIYAREWKPVVIKIEGTTLQIFEEYELSAPFREIPLQAYFVMTAPKLQSFEHGAKVHTVKLEYIKYAEKRSLRHRGTIEHLAQSTVIIKVASPSHTVIRELLETFNNSLRLLPSYRDRGITYRQDEVFVDIDDVTNVILSSDGTILRKSAKVLIKLRAFLTGDPECQLVLNDVVVREREEARLRGELKPQRVHHWVKLRHCDFHKCANAATFEQSHAITFHPLDACTFELMRFPIDHCKPLPLQVKTMLNIHSEQRVEFKAEIQVCQDTKMAKYVRNNVVFRFPIPESWVPLFRTGKVLGGEKSIKSSKDRRAAGIKSRLKHSKCSIGVSLGKAKYEPEYGSVVWRIDHLPFIHSKIPADAPQTLSVVLDLPPGMDFPENYKPRAELEYDVAYVLVSDTTVIAVKVSNQNIPDKWVCYRALYHYDVNIEISRPSSGPVRDVGCTQQ